MRVRSNGGTAGVDETTLRSIEEQGVVHGKEPRGWNINLIIPRLALRHKH